MRNYRSTSCTCTPRPFGRMMAPAAAALVGLGLAGAVAAQVGNVAPADGPQTSPKTTNADAATLWEGMGNVGVGVRGGTTAGTTSVDIDVTGIESIDAFQSGLNEVLNINLGANAHVTAIGYDVTLEAFDPSWLSEMRMEMTDTGVTTGVGLTPGVGNDGPGSMAFSSGGLVDLIGLGLDFNVGADGNLRVEFWETFVDFPGVADGVWVSGTVTIVHGDGGPPPPPGSDCCVANGSPGCDDQACQDLVCGQDSFCCDTEWDSICADLANEECDVCTGGGGDSCPTCCEATGVPGCEDPDCQALICGQDSFCCDVSWDSICADAANAQCACCDTGNGGDCGTGDCCSANGTPGCEDESCCNAVCACDPFCCDVEWDTFCATTGFDADCLCGPGQCGAQNTAECQDLCGGPVDPCDGAVGDCCESNGSPGCDDPDCCALICAQDAFCCDTSWDGLCAGAAADQCEVCGDPVDPCENGVGDCCVEGGNGSPACDDPECCALICAQDAFCCETSWDGLCAGAAQEQCNVCQPDEPGIGCQGPGFWKNHPELWPTYSPDDLWSDVFACGDDPDPGVCGPDAGDCCASNGTPGCDQPECCDAICAEDAFCCDTSWDSLCAGAAEDHPLCDCEPGGGTGDCCVSNGSPGCEDADCQALICGQDAFCCDVTWDSLCADAANAQCDVCDGGGGDLVNNECSGATEVFDGDNAFTNVGATTTGPEHAACDGGFAQPQIFNDVYFTYVATQSGDLTISTCNQATFDTKIGAYDDGCNLSDAALIGCNDDGPGCAGFTSLLTVPVSEGNSYTIRVGAFGATQFGTGTLTLSYGGGGGGSDCCTPGGNGTPGCDDADCQALICGQDSFCCDVSWDGICADAAAAQCAVCSGGVAGGSKGDGGVAADYSDAFEGKTLMDVLSQPAGGQGVPPQVATLGRFAVQALLNSASGGGFPLSSQEVIDTVCAALASRDIQTIIQTAGELAEMSGSGCVEMATGDINVDAEVGLGDLMIVLSEWGANGNSTADVNQDGSVDTLDLLEVLSQWGPAPPTWQPHNEPVTFDTAN